MQREDTETLSSNPLDLREELLLKNSLYVLGLLHYEQKFVFQQTALFIQDALLGRVKQH